MVTHIEESRESNFLLWLEIPFMQGSTQYRVSLLKCIAVGPPGSDGHTHADDGSLATALT